MPHPGLLHTYSKWQRNQRVRDAVAKAAPGEVRLREINAGFGIQSAATTVATMVPVMLPPTMLQPPGTLVQPVVGVIVGGTMVGETKIDLATGGKNCSLAKLLADLFSPKPQPTTKKKLSLLRCHALPDRMPPLDKSPSPVGGRQRNSRATPIYPSTTLPAKRFARFALLSMK